MRSSVHRSAQRPTQEYRTEASAMLQCAALNGMQIAACPPALLPHGFRRWPMESNDLKSMSSDELWGLYEEVAVELAGKIATKKARLEERLRKIESAAHVTSL